MSSHRTHFATLFARRVIANNRKGRTHFGRFFAGLAVAVSGVWFLNHGELMWGTILLAAGCIYTGQHGLTFCTCGGCTCDLEDEPPQSRYDTFYGMKR